MEKIYSIIQKNLDSFEEEFQKYALGKDALLIFGRTGVGKSSTIHFLLNQPLKVINKGGMYVLESELNSEPRIGFTSNSCTFIPCPYYSKDLDLNIWDGPGFYDVRNIESEIINGYYFKKMINSLNGFKVRIIYLMDESKLETERGGGFVEEFKELCSYFKNFEQIHDSIMIVFSKCDSFENADSIIKRMREITKTHGKISDNIRKMILKFTFPDKISMIYKVGRDEDIKTKNSLENLIGKIKSIKHIEACNIKAKQILSQDAKDILFKLLKDKKEEVYMGFENFEKEIEPLINNFLTKNIKDEIDRIINLRKSFCDLPDLFIEISNGKAEKKKLQNFLTNFIFKSEIKFYREIHQQLDRIYMFGTFLENNKKNLEKNYFQNTIKIFDEKVNNQISKLKKIERISHELEQEVTKILNTLENNLKAKEKSFYEKIISCYNEFGNDEKKLNVNGCNYFNYIDKELMRFKNSLNLEMIEKLKNEMNEGIRISTNDIELFFGEKKFKCLAHHFDATRTIFKTCYPEYVKTLNENNHLKNEYAKILDENNILKDEKDQAVNENNILKYEKDQAVNENKNLKAELDEKTTMICSLSICLVFVVVVVSMIFFLASPTKVNDCDKFKNKDCVEYKNQIDHLNERIRDLNEELQKCKNIQGFFIIVIILMGLGLFSLVKKLRTLPSKNFGKNYQPDYVNKEINKKNEKIRKIEKKEIQNENISTFSLEDFKNFNYFMEKKYK